MEVCGSQRRFFKLITMKALISKIARCFYIRFQINFYYVEHTVKKEIWSYLENQGVCLEILNTGIRFMWKFRPDFQRLPYKRSKTKIC